MSDATPPRLLTSAPTSPSSGLVEPNYTYPDGRRFWRLTETIQMTLHPNGHIEISDSTGLTYRVRHGWDKKGAELHLVPRPGAA
jgi:hypothetical protein